MAKTSIPSHFGSGGAGTTDVLPKVLRELQNIKEVVVDGAAANTEIAVTGLLAGYTVVDVTAFASGVPSKPTAKTGNADGFISSTGKIKLTEDSTGAKLLVRYTHH